MVNSIFSCISGLLRLHSGSRASIQGKVAFQERGTRVWESEGAGGQVIQSQSQTGDKETKGDRDGVLGLRGHPDVPLRACTEAAGYF